MTLANPSGEKIIARTMYSEGVSSKGFKFSTDERTESNKDLNNLPQAAILFWDPETSTQLRAQGRIVKASQTESIETFNRLSREEQLRIATSDQSTELETPTEHEEKIRKLEMILEGKPIAKPSYWHTYYLQPERLHFWRQTSEMRTPMVINFTKDVSGNWKGQQVYS